MTTYTIAQALATSATGLTVLDSAGNISWALPNAALTARVSVFDISASATIATWQAENLANLGSKFNKNGFTLTIRDTVAGLTSAANAAGLTISGIVITVSDTAANIVAAATNSIIRNASVVALSASATVSLAQLLTLEGLAGFTATGVTLTLADSAANLLALTVPEQRPTLTVFQVSSNSTVGASAAITLGALSHFSVASGATLTIADTITNLNTNVNALAGIMALSGVVEVAADSVANLLSQTVALQSLESHMPHLTVSLAGSSSATVSQLVSLAALPGFRAGTGNVLTVTDTVANLLTLTTGQKALIQATALVANDAANAAQLALLAALPSFSRGARTLVVTDSLANLGALTVVQRGFASSSVVDDTVTNVLAAQVAHSTTLSAAATVTAELDGNNISVAQIASLLTLPGITLHANGTSSTLTVADSVAHLLTLTTGQKAVIQATTLLGNDAASASQLTQLTALPGFARGSGHTLVVTDTLSNLGALTTPQRALASSSVVDDTVTNVLAAQVAHSTTLSAAATVTAELDGNNITVAQLTSLLTLPGITLHPNGTSSTLTIADTVADLLTLTTPQKALIQATTLIGNETANASQLVQLAALPSFAHGNGHTLVVTDSLANLGALTTPQRAFASSITADDTLTNILAALTAHSTTLSAAGAVTAELDGSTITVAQAASLLTLPGLHLHANGSNTVLTVADTMQNLAAGATTLTALSADGSITESPTNDHTILTASAAATLISLGGFNPANYTLAVADTGAAVTTNASQLFGQGFEAITVTSGTFTGTQAQLLDSTLHFSAGASARLGSNATLSAAQALTLAALPNFSVAGGVTLAVQDTIGTLIADATTLSHVATSITVTDAETVSMAGAMTLATLQSAVGNSHFSFGTNDTLTVRDTPATLLASGNAAGVALATTTGVSQAVSVTVATANQLAALHGFSADANPITIADTPANLATLSGAAALIGVQQTILAYTSGAAADYTLNTTQFGALTGLSSLSWAGFGGPLTVQDTASQLAVLETLLAGASRGSALSLSRGIITTALSQNAVNISAATLLLLEALPGFGLGGHSLTVQDAPSTLLADFTGSTVPFASGVTLSGNAGAWVVNASDATRLAGMPAFNAGTAGIQVQDNVPDILASANAAGVAAASSVLLNASAIVTVSQIEALEHLNGFSRNGQSLTISDTETNLVTLDSTAAALATSIQTVGSPDVSVSQYTTLSGTPGFLSSGNSVVISDTASNLLALVGLTLTQVTSIVVQPSTAILASQAESLSTLANLLTGGNVTIADTVANLIHVTGAGPLPDDEAGELLATTVTITADATITVAQGALLAPLGARFGNGGFHLTLQDTPANLLTAYSMLGPIMGQVTATVLASNGGTPWSVTIAQMQQLDILPSLGLGSSGATIADSVPDILFSGNASIVNAATSVTLNGNATGGSSVSVAQAEALHALSNFSLGSYQLNILDGIGHLATLDSGTANLATSIQLQGSGLATVAQFNAIRALPNYSNNGKLLVVSDTATTLAGLTGTLTLASAIMLSASVANLTAAAAEQLASLPNFTTGIASMAVVDSASDLVAGAGSSPDDWAGEMAATSVTLNALGSAITAAQADDLALLGGRFSTGGNTLTVQDTIAHLVSGANAAGVSLATVVSLTQNETAVSVANWAQVTAFSNFSKAGHTVTVSDTAAAIAAASPALLAQANEVQLSAAATLTVAAAESLAGIANFQANVAAPITVADTLPDLLLLSTNSNSVITAAPIELSANALVTVAQLGSLAALPQYSTFSTNGHTITVEDSGAHLAAYTPDSIAVPASYVMIGDATLSPTQGNRLVAENISLGDNHLTIASDPTSLLSLSTALNALATGLTLNTASSATVAQATSLALDGRFTTGGDAFTVTGSAAALLTFNTSYGQMATTLALSESGDVVSVANLLQLAELGTKFSLATHTMTVSDTAASLASLNSFETALVSAAVLNATPGAAIDTTTATELAALPNFSLGTSVTLTVQGTYAELVALPSLIQSIATLELTSAGTLSAAQAAALAALPTFSAAPSVVVQDTIGALNNVANAGWPSAATGGYIVTDSVINLLDNVSTMLLTNANSVTLLGDSQVDAADFATLAGMSNFSRGSAALVVQDSAGAIAANATEIALVASSALVDSAPPVSAAAAEALAGLNTLHILSFTGGVSLAVQDLYSTFDTGSYTAGIALARTIIVLGSATDLVAATSFNWATATVTYELNAGGNITGATAVTLYGLGSNYLPQSYVLTVVDTAAHVVSDATAIQALGIHAQITDVVAGVQPNVAALVALGGTLQSVTLNDGATAVLAAAAASLAPLVGKLTGPTIAVSDTALAVDGNLAALETLAAHISGVTVSDSAVNIAPYASALVGLGSELHISLTDTPPISVTATVGAELAPLATQLAGVTLNVSDIGSAVGTHATALAALGSVLGTVTLSDGTTTTAAIATELVPILGHLGGGVTLNIADSASAIVGAAATITTLGLDSRLGTIAANNETAAHIVTYGTTLAGLGATATILDSAENVSANLDALEAFSHPSGLLQSITLNDSADIAVSIGQFTSDADVLALIGGSFKYAITDSSANIAADLGAAGSSHILGLGASVHTITVTGGTLSLSASTLLATGVDAALAQLAGGTLITATSVTIANFTAIGLLAIGPNSYAVADTGAHIASDLETGAGSSELLAYRTSTTSITPTGTISIDYTTATTTHVDDGAGSVFSKMPGATLEVTGVLVANVAAMFALPVAASEVAVTDTAADIQGDLSISGSVLVQYLSQLDTVTASPGGNTITLDATHALRAGVDDSASSVFGKLSGATLTVTGATVAQLGTLYGLYDRPAGVAVSDLASSIATDLQLGASSVLETYAADGFVTGVTVQSGPVTLDDTYIVGAITAALAVLPSSSLAVTNVPIVDIAAVAGLSAFLSMTVSTNVATLAANLGAGSPLATYAGVITGMTITDGPLVLTDAAALAANATALSTLPSSSLDVTGVAVGDVATIAGIAALASMTVSDSAAHIATDLRLGSLTSVLDLHAAQISTVAVNDVGPVAAADAATVSALVAKLTGPAFAVSDLAAAVDTALTGLEALGTHLSTVTVSDSAADVAPYASDLIALGSKLVISLTDGTTFTTTAAVAADLVPLVTQLAGSTINVSDTGSTIASDATTLAELGILLGTVTLSDGDNTNAATAAGLVPIAGNLGIGVTINVTDSASAIAGATGLVTLQGDNRLGTVTSDNQIAADIVTYGTTLAGLGATATILDSAENVSANLDALEAFSHPSGLLQSITLNDSADIAVSIGQFTSDADVLALIGGSFKYAITDSSANIAADLGAGGSSHILGLGASVHTITVTGGTLSLSASTLLATGVDAALAQLAGGTLITATSVTIANFTAIGLLAIGPNSYAVADTGAHIATDLETGAGSSELLAYRTSITSIAPTGTISIDYTTATTTHVDDGAGSVISKMPGATLEVTGVLVANVAAMFALPVAASEVAVTDTAADIQSDLSISGSVLVQYLSQLDTVTASPGGNTITLDATHALRAGVDNSASSVFGKLSGATLSVTGATVAQLGTLYGLYDRPAGVAVSDLASSIATDLQLGASSVLETYAADGFVTGVTVQSGPVTLDDSYIVGAITAALAVLPSSSLAVTNVPIADIAAVAGLSAFLSMTVSTNVATLAANLGAGSPLATYAGVITGMTITDGPLVLTDAAALAANATALSTLPSSSLEVTGVAVGDVATIAGIAALASMTVTDGFANITTDLQLGSSSSELELNASKISSITVTGGTVSLTDAQAAQVTDALAKLSAGSLTISGASVANAATYGVMSALSSMTVSDTAAHVHADLIAGTSMLETYAATHVITAITVTDASVGLTDTQAETVLDALAVLGGGNGLTVSGVSVQDIPNIGVLAALTGMTVTDTATDIHNDLVLNTASNLYIYAGSITGVTITGGPVHITAAEEPDVQVTALALLPADTLVVDDVPVASVASIAVLPALIDMSVSDTASNVQTDLASGGAHDLENYAAVISSITVTGGQVTLAYSDASGDLAALALLVGPDTLVVTAVPVADVGSIAAISALGSMTVSDTDVNLQTNLAGASSTLEQYYASISSIGFSSGSTITLTGAEAALVMGALAELPGSSLTVTAATASQIAALAALGSLTSMTVSDTGSHISAALSTIETDIALITNITITSGSVTVEYTAVAAVMDALAALPAGSLTVDDVPVADITAITGLGAPLAAMTITDSGTTITTDLALGGSSVIETNIGLITAINVSAGSVSLTDAQADAVSGALAVLQSGSVTVTGVPVGSDITTFYGLASVAGMTITDTAGNVQTDLISGGVIEAAVSKINSINIGGGTVALTDAQADAVLAALAKLPATSLTVSGVPVSDIGTIGALTALTSMAINDTGGTIGTNLAIGATSSIYINRAKISGITLSSGSVSLTDSAADAVFAALSLLPSASLTVTGVPLSDVAHIFSLGAVLSGMTVSDTYSAIQSDLVSGSIITTNAAGITSITPTGGQVSLTDTQAETVIGVLNKLSASSLLVSGVTAAHVATIGAVTSLSHMTVSDTASAINTNLGLGGGSSILNDLALITSVAANDATVGAVTAASIYGALALKFTETSLVIADTGANIVTVANGANAAVLSRAASVQLSGNVIGMDAADATTLSGVLHGTQTASTVNVVDTAANLLSAGNAAGLTLATTIGVDDVAANILALAPQLLALGSKFVSTVITDTGPLSASAVTDLLALPNLSAGTLTIEDTGSQIAAAIVLNGTTGVNFLNANTVELSMTSTIAASDAAALEQLSSLNKNGFAIDVSDTATHLTGSYLAAVSVTPLIDGVYLKTTGGTVTVTAAVAASLTSIPNFSKNPVGGGTNILIVQDTAAHFDSSYATLDANLALFDHMYLSPSATVLDSVYGELLALGVQPATGGVTLTVRDSATNIANNATAQLAGSPSITPIAWQLSGSATLTEAQAAVLGGLSGYTSGAFTLTLSASASGVSVSSANALGVLGSAFHLGGFAVNVPGSVSVLSALTTAALTAGVTPQISDTFTNIAAGLTSASPLLLGTLTVTDSEAISVVQATHFFALVKVGSGAGIPAANITFGGGVQTVTDTLANVQTLTGLSTWTGNTGLQTDFHLVVADTVANLINAANTTALSGMFGTALVAGQPAVTAQALETLFTLENTIHFSLGGSLVTIQDTAANLLAPNHSDAIGLATTITLLGPDTVGAAGAETLMASGKLALTGSTILTISDTSVDLLDGVLGGAISGGGFTSYVHVTLSDNETLDAQTAEALVSLPGYYAGSSTLSIVDGVSYLLNAANNTGEADATSVTLDGDADVSAAIAVALAAVPHFALDGNTLYLASNDYADAPTLTTLAGLGVGFSLNGNTLTMTQNASVTASQLAAIGDFGSALHPAGHTLTLSEDALALSPVEYTALQSDNVVLGGHAWSAIPAAVSVSEVSNNVQIAGTGVNGATVTLYSATGTVLTTTSAAPAFTISAAESGGGINVAATETVGGTESTPIIALEQTILTGAATTDSVAFAASGQVQVGAGEYMNLYTAGSQPGTLTNPVLIYDPAAHTLSYADGHQTIVLVTLGTATHPTSLDASDIFVKHYV